MTRWTIFSLLCMAEAFAIGWLHADIAHWTWSQCIPFAKSRAVNAGVLFELALLAQLIVAGYLLFFGLRRWASQAPEFPSRTVPPQQRVIEGVKRLIVLLVVVGLAYWASENADAHLSFRDLVVRKMGINPNDFENCTAFATLFTTLSFAVVSIFLFWGHPQSGGGSPVFPAAQAKVPFPPPPPVQRPAPQPPPPPFRRP